MSRKKLEDIEDGCPLPNTHRRLAASHRLWHQALKVYCEPDAFRTNLNATIQELRNVTFVLQKEQQSIPNFAAWYQPHRDALREDPLLRWGVESRNYVVKQGDLETRSTAKVALVDGYFERPTLITDVPPFATAEEIAATFAREAPAGIRDAYLLVERRWEVESLPGLELLDVLATCYARLDILVADAHRVAGAEYTRVACPSGRSHPLKKVLSCMSVARERRMARIDLETRAVTNIRYRRANRSAKIQKIARERYGYVPDPVAMRGDYPTKARELHRAARAIIKAEPELATAVNLFRRGEPVHLAMLLPDDQAAKYALWREVAAAVQAFDADAIIANVESWLRPLDDGEQTQECVMTFFEAADGAALQILSIFRREGNDVVLEAPVEFPSTEGLNVLEPIRAVWRRRTSST